MVTSCVLLTLFLRLTFEDGAGEVLFLNLRINGTLPAVVEPFPGKAVEQQSSSSVVV